MAEGGKVDVPSSPADGKAQGKEEEKKVDIPDNTKASPGKAEKKKKKKRFSTLGRKSRGNGKIQWMSDGDAVFCPLCSTTFSIFTRKHHCRKCGNIFCDACSDHRINLPEYGFTKPVRACSKCAEGGFFLSPADNTDTIRSTIHIPQSNDEDIKEHQKHQQQHLMNLQQRKRDFSQVVPTHEGPMPTADTVQSFHLPSVAKMITLPDGSVIQRGLLNFVIRSISGKALAINPIPAYIPTSQRPASPPEFITKSGRFQKMSFGDTNVWLEGELKLKGIELSWDSEKEGEGWARMGAGSGVKVLEPGGPNKDIFLVEVSTYEATTQMWNLINGMNTSNEIDRSLDL
eukprot:Phypoly_transcript_10414.p1 GENE.Phypoly_transcript_10414~~Phypoly_transcript_10414.p1  ORF type:complete len:357 (+),score=73.21 Phypoly_transcript_10414:41-1072(+)